MRASRGTIVFVIALGWLVFAVAYGYGLLSYKYNLWPYSAIVEVWRFVAGDREESTTLIEKVMSDTGLKPTRHLMKPAKPAHPAAAYRRLSGLPLAAGREAPMVYLSPDAPRGYRILFGTFAFEGALHGAVLLDPDGKVRRVWKVSQNDLPWPHERDTNIFPHGFAVGRDGGILVAYDSGASLTKYGFCGGVEWRLQGDYHHSIELHDDGTLWVWRKGAANAATPGNNKRDGAWVKDPEPWREGTRDESAYRIAYADGKVLRHFSIQDMIDANPDIGIFSLRQEDGAKNSRWADDPYHPNDLEPLPRAFAGRYPGFAAGDLLISLRSIDLVAVIDPATLKVKWWRQGQTRRQHDPDWNDRGTITIFNNSMHRPPSTIAEIDPKTMRSRILVDGAKYDLYSWAQGNHDVLPGGGVLIASSLQGRAFEVAPDGRVTFDFHNIYSAEAGTLLLSEARFLPPDYFQPLPDCAARR